MGDTSQYMSMYYLLDFINLLKYCYTVFRQALLLRNIVIYAINEINISYKISINYCTIKMQIVIILSRTLNTSTAQS